MNHTQSQSKTFKRTASPELSRWYMGIVLTHLVEKKGNNGEFSLLEATLVPGTEPPPHVHWREDEFFYVLAGEFDSVPKMLDLLCRAIHQSVPAITAFKANSTPHSKLVVQHLDWQPHLL